ncbi:hypothetical protein ACOSQ2_017924 [Xanthoceras sorbifolium]
MAAAVLIFLLCLTAGALTVRCEDPYLYYTWNVTYGTLSPLGIPQQVILINGQFPGPTINSTTNNNVVVNVFNNLDEPFLLTWNGIQHRKNSWQDGVLGTMCPIAPGTNYTYRFQVKDQIGTYMYYPTTGLHRAAGGFGGLNVHSRIVIPVPYAQPEDDFYVLINDWYGKSHSELRKMLDSGRTLARPQGVLINGKSGKPDGKGEPLFTLKSGKTYKFRICNVGLRTSLNFRIQGHTMKLVEMEGSHVVQNVYQSLDVHIGQCFAVLVTADQTPKDYYMVASSRFLKGTPLISTAIIRYADGQGVPASPELPKAPVGWAWSLNQFRTLRWNLTASAARPNPQGSYHYGEINITRTFKFANSASKVDGKLRYAINGVSHTNPATPPKFAEYYGIPEKVFKYDVMGVEAAAKISKVSIETNVLNVTFHDFVEIIFENRENTMQSWHLDGYSFFAVAIEPGTWTPEKRKNYNLQDGVSRHTIQVFPKSWAAILLTFDNAGMWNIRSEMRERAYLGQELYVSVYSPRRSLKEEYNLPDNAPLCGVVANLPKPEPYNA